MSLLKDYEQQYAVLTAEITAQIGRIAIFNGAERRELVSKVDTSLSEAKELLEQMQLEIRDLEPPLRQSWTNKLNCAQAELKRLETEYKSAQDKSQNAAAYESMDDFEDIGMRDEQKQRLLSNSERIERTGNRLTEGYRIVLETEQIGSQVLQDLHHQRETLQSARSRMRETNADLGRASRTLNSMMARALREKALLFGIGTVFVIVVSLSIYFSFSK